MRVTRALAVGLLGMLATAAYSQDDAVVKKWDFEQDLGGWESLDPKGQVSRTDADDATFKGDWALEFTFTPRLPAKDAAEEFPGVIAVEPDCDTSSLRSIEFAVAAAFSTPVGVILREEDASSYMVPVWAEAGRWNKCRLALSDFVLSSDSTDENGRLDPGQISHLAFADVSILARALAQKGLPVYVPPLDEMSLWLDDIVLSSTEVVRGGTSAQDERRIMIASCDEETIRWMSIGGEDVSLTTESLDAEDGKHLKIKYVSPAGTIFGVMREFQAGTLAGCKAVSLEMRCELASNVLFLVEETGEGRYIQMRQLPATDGWQRIELPFAGFRADRQPQGAGGRVAPEKIRQLAIADPSGAMQNAISANTWLIRNVVGVK